MGFKKLTEEEFVKLAYSKKNQVEYWEEKKDRTYPSPKLIQCYFSSPESEHFAKGFPIYSIFVTRRSIPGMPLAENVIVSHSSKYNKDGNWSSATDMGLPFALLDEVQKMVKELVDNPPEEFKSYLNKAD